VSITPALAAAARRAARDRLLVEHDVECDGRAFSASSSSSVPAGA
jgi:hypothetical protein